MSDSDTAPGGTVPSNATDPIRQGSAFAEGDLVANRFRIKRLLGKGGMGAVYAAADTALNGEIVALKTILPVLDQDGTALRRFKREVQYARMITHPNVCRVFDLGYHELSSFGGGNANRVIFVTMEYLRGETLSDFLQKTGPLPHSRALPIVRQLAASLSAAHAAGVIHRDFKTPNVMLVSGKTGSRAVVTDFGLACLSEDESNVESRLTKTGFFVGSPLYIAPEQIDGGEVTNATDVFAFGVLLYEMLTGQFPFVASTPLATAIKRLTDPPTRPRVHLPSIDPGWEAVILRCLARRSEDRFQDMAEVVRALEEAQVPSVTTISSNNTTVTLPQAPSSKWRWPFLVPAVALTGLAAFIATKNLGLMSLIWFLIIGMIAGWLAGKLMRRRGFGVVGDLIVGIIGALIGGWVLGLFGISAGGGLIGALITAFVGAMLLLFLIRLIHSAYEMVAGSQ